MPELKTPKTNTNMTGHRVNRNVSTDYNAAFLQALMSIQSFVSGYYLNLKTRRYIAISQEAAYNDRYNSEDDWARMDDYIRECVHPEDQALITGVSRIEYIRERLKKEQSFHIDIRDLGTGEERWYRYSTIRCVSEDHAAIVFRDITDLMESNSMLEKLNSELEENQAELEAASAEQEAQIEEIGELNSQLKNAYGMIEGFSQEYHTIWVVNKDDLMMKLIRSTGKATIKSAVQMGEKLVNYDSTVKAYVKAFVEPEDRERVYREMGSEEVLRHLEKGGIYAVNYLRKDESGHVGYHQIAFANADSESGKKQFVLGFRDIDKIVREEQKQKEEFRRAKEAAESANAAKTSFLFNMSHDIRTPMNAIIGFRALLEQHQEDPQRRRDYLKKIEQSSNVLLSIINNILEMARIEKGSMEIEETAWSAEQFNDTLWSVFNDMMAEKRLTFTRQIDVKNDYVYCDPTKLREIFINILSNAYKYTDAGGSVNMHLEEVPGNREGWAFYKTTITDTGRGMSKDFLPHIFEEFTREKNTTEAKVEGTGLGMPIVKKLVDMLDGTIEVKSELGKGSTFIVTIPHRIAKRENLVKHDDIAINPEIFDGKRILLAEDNDLNAEIATEILAEAGFQVERARDGKECCEMLESDPDGWYDLILMDIQMPNMNGYEAARTIRAMKDNRKAGIPIVAMTANAFEEDRRTAMRSGMNEHIAKPINIKELMRTLTRILN